MPAPVLAEIVGSRLSEVEELLVDLAGEYARDGRGFVLRAIAGGWRLYTHPGAQTAVEAYLRAGQQSRLTRAALETLAVIAYRQPVTRFQVAAVRGVNVDGVFRTLASRGLIHEVGTDPGPGQAILYGTTQAFLEQLGLNDLDQLPRSRTTSPRASTSSISRSSHDPHRPTAARWWGGSVAPAPSAGAGVPLASGGGGRARPAPRRWGPSGFVGRGGAPPAPPPVETVPARPPLGGSLTEGREWGPFRPAPPLGWWGSFSPPPLRVVPPPAVGRRSASRRPRR